MYGYDPVWDILCSSSWLRIENFDKQSVELKTAKDQVKTLQDSCNSLKENIHSLEIQQNQTKSKVTDNEYRSMRENLICYGIEETKHNSVNQEPERCEAIVKEFIKKNLEIDAEQMIFDRAHRLYDFQRSKIPRRDIEKVQCSQDRKS